jgi:hypothetical protein
VKAPINLDDLVPNARGIAGNAGNMSPFDIFQLFGAFQTATPRRFSSVKTR